MRQNRLTAALLLATTLLAAGCDSGPTRQRVTGAVTYKGQPLKSGLISFVPKGTTASAGGASITDGRYEVPAAAGLLPGEYEVIVSAPTAGSGRAPEGEEAPGEGGEKATRETLPARYNARTELTAEVKAGGANEFDFHLK